MFLRDKLTNRRPSKYQYILTFEDSLKLKETDIVDSCNKVIGHCANHSGSPGFEVYLNKTMLFSVWTYQELADALSIFEDNVKKRLKVVCGELTIKAIYVLEKKWRYYIERKNSLTENEPMLAGEIRRRNRYVQVQRISGALTPGIRRQICLWETLTKILDEHLNSFELSASSENAFKLYNFLNKGERR